LNAAPGAGDKPAADAWLIYRRLLKYAKPYSWVFFIGVLGAILFAAANASLVILVRNFLDGAFIQKNPDVLWQVPLGVIVLFTVRGIGDYIANYYPSWVGRQVVKGLRHDVFAHYMRLPTAYLDRQQSGHLLSKLTNNVELVAADKIGPETVNYVSNIYKYYVAYKLGLFVTGSQSAAPPRLDLHLFALPIMQWIPAIAHWFALMGKPFAVGLVLLALILAVAGYLLVLAAWRVHVVLSWRKRGRSRIPSAQK